jgi:hypothetical protein
VAEEPFNLVVLGQFKRGQSTLINVLLKRDSLRTGVVPLTSVVIIYRRRRRGAAAGLLRRWPRGAPARRAGRVMTKASGERHTFWRLDRLSGIEQRCAELTLNLGRWVAAPSHTAAEGAP